MHNSTKKISILSLAGTKIMLAVIVVLSGVVAAASLKAAHDYQEIVRQKEEALAAAIARDEERRAADEYTLTTDESGRQIVQVDYYYADQTGYRPELGENAPVGSLSECLDPTAYTSFIKQDHDNEFTLCFPENLFTDMEQNGGRNNQRNYYEEYAVFEENNERYNARVEEHIITPSKELSDEERQQILAEFVEKIQADQSGATTITLQTDSRVEWTKASHKTGICLLRGNELYSIEVTLSSSEEQQYADYVAYAMANLWGGNGSKAECLTWDEWSKMQ